MSAAVSKTNIPLKDLLLRKLLRDDVDDPASHGQETDVAGVFFLCFFFIFPFKEMLRPANMSAYVRVGNLKAAAAGEPKNHSLYHNQCLSADDLLTLFQLSRDFFFMRQQRHIIICLLFFF